MHSLSEIIKTRIAQNGLMTIAEYMDLCLSHPQFGYYMRRDPFGTAGDFTTAPEISQLFGEMIGLWVLDSWRQLGKPSDFILCECGPGRGTLMRDILRCGKIMPGFLTAARINLVETSPLLREKQHQNLNGFAVAWHDKLTTLPVDAPLILIGNEFLDALPFNQAVKTAEGWRENCIALEDGELVFRAGSVIPGSEFPYAVSGEIYEYSPLRDAIWIDICTRIKAQKGAALMIDYGFMDDAVGDSFQAVQKHEFVSVFTKPGEADLTSHVNFARLRQLARGLSISGPMTQGEFLQSLGIAIRAADLSRQNPQNAAQIDAGLKRLINRDQMGELFKAIYVSNL